MEPKDQEPGFEDALKRMEEIAGRLEKPDVDLEEALRLYEEGVRLARLCAERLRSAELRISELKPATEPDGAS